MVLRERVDGHQFCESNIVDKFRRPIWRPHGPTFEGYSVSFSTSTPSPRITVQLLTMARLLLLAAALLPQLIHAHGGHGHDPAPSVAPDADWVTRHMAEEHHIASFDAGSFFTLHDYDSSGVWTVDDLMKTYGLKDESTNHISEDDKSKAIHRVIKMFDRDADGQISYAEYTIGTAKGLGLPDLGYGPGHHGDDEYEYEIHHFEKYHDENTREEDLIHPEDIAHFRKHDEMDARQEQQERLDRMPIVEQNIPKMFRRSEL